VPQELKQEACQHASLPAGAETRFPDLRARAGRAFI